MRITQLELKNIGPFANQVFDFAKNQDPDKAEVHILTGVNGSGKSTVLYGLASGFDVTSVANRFRFSDDRSHTKLRFQDVDEQVLVSYNNSSQLRLNAPAPIRKYRTYTHLNHAQFRDVQFEFSIFAYSGSRTIRSANVNAIQELQGNPLKNSLDFQDSIDSLLLLQWIANTKAKVAFALQEGNTELADNYTYSITQIESSIKQIIDVDISFTFQYNPLKVGIQVSGEKAEFDFLSDGTKSIISWIADLLIRLDRMKWINDTSVLDRKFILLLDEIEIHLHPRWQRKILPVVQKLFKNAQIFIATHSPFVVGSVEDAWVYKLGVQDGNSVLETVERSMAGSSYTAVLDEIFGIDEYFDVETEQKLEKFYQLRNEYLSGQENKLQCLLNIGQALASKSVEIQDIIGRELRQLQRITGKEIQL